MEKIFYLPTEQLKGNNENPFPTLSDREFKDLKESIMKYGIMEPLIVYPNNGSSYEVISGNHRLRVAREIGLKNVPCTIIDISKIEGAFDTEVFRRHIPTSEREKYIKLKSESSKARLEKELRRLLIPEIYQIYMAKKLSQDDAIHLAVSGVGKQKSLLASLSIQREDKDERIEKPKEKEEVNNLKMEIEKLKKELGRKENEISELKKWKEEKKLELQKKISELEKEKNKVSESVPEKYINQLRELESTNENLRRQIREKEKEIDKITEAKTKIEEALRRKEEEKKTQRVAEDIELQEKKRDYWQSVIENSMFSVAKILDSLEHSEINCLLKKQVSNIRKEMQKIIHRLEKFDQKLALLEA